jgi:hypothetical protein
MTWCKIVATLVMLSATAATPASSKTLLRPLHDDLRLRTDRAAATGRTWCFHNFSQDELDCSYIDESQCAATASGALGECDIKPW